MNKKLKELRKNLFVEISAWGGLSQTPGIEGTIITKDNKIYIYHEYDFVSEDLKDIVSRKGISEGKEVKKGTIEKLNDYIKNNIEGKSFLTAYQIDDASFHIVVDYNNKIYEIDDYPNIFSGLMEIIEKNENII